MPLRVLKWHAASDHISRETPDLLATAIPLCSSQFLTLALHEECHYVYLSVMLQVMISAGKPQIS